MPVTDPVADMLTRIRNALIAKHDVISIPSSKMKKSIAQILLTEGYIKGYEFVRRRTAGQPEDHIKIRTERRTRHHRFKAYQQTRSSCVCEERRSA